MVTAVFVSGRAESSIDLGISNQPADLIIDLFVDLMIDFNYRPNL